MYVRDQTNFESHRRHNIASLSKTRMPRLSTGTNRSRHDMAEKLLTVTESIKFDIQHGRTNMLKATCSLIHLCKHSRTRSGSSRSGSSLYASGNDSISSNTNG